jgi:ABC-type sugar transport system substrate-binding protein
MKKHKAAAVTANPLQAQPMHEVLLLIPAKLTRPFFAELYCECENSIYDHFGDYLRPIWRCVPRESDEFDERTVLRVLRREMRQSNAIRLMVVVPTASKQIAACVAEIGKDRNIPIVALTLPFHCRSVFRKLKLPIPPVVHCDNAQGTRQLGEAAGLEYRRRRPGTQTPSLVLLPGEGRRIDSITRLRNFVLGIQDTGLRPHVVSARPCYWQRLAARCEIQRLADQKGTPIDVVFAANDEMALGARDAILASAGDAAARLLSNTIVYGFDASFEACSLIQQNDTWFKGTIKQNLPEMAEALAELIEQVLRKKKLPSRFTVAVKPTCILPQLTESRLDLLQRWPTIPALDLTNGQWVADKDAAGIERVDESALSDYRKSAQGCKRAEGGKLGQDRFGRMWRRDDRSGRVYYLWATLLKVAQ